MFLKKNIDARDVDTKRAIYEIGVEKVNLAEVFESLQERTTTEESSEPREAVRFKQISPYPFVVRDIALWIGGTDEGLETGTIADAVREVIKKSAGDLLVSVRLFDTFEKDARVSLAFRLVFQSPERTLTDEEVNYQMWQVTQALGEGTGFEVR